MDDRAVFERVPLERMASFTVRHCESPKYRFRLHYHPELELSLVIRGRGVRLAGDSIDEFLEGDLCLFGANLPHGRFSTREAGPIHTLVVQFLPDFGKPLLASQPEFRPLARLYQSAERGLKLAGDTRDRVASLLRLLSGQPPGSMERTLTLLRALGLMCGDATCVPLSDQSPVLAGAPAGDDRLRRVLARLQCEPYALPSQREVAELIGMSPQSFSRFFKRRVGKTYVEYVNRWRVAIACRSMVEAGVTITEAAFAAGFESISNFNRRFRAVKGVSPSEFRNGARCFGAAPGSDPEP